MPGLSDYADCRGMSELLSAPPATVSARQPSTSERETTRSNAIAHVIYTNRTNRFRVNCPARRTHRHFVNNSRLPARGSNAGGPRPKRAPYHWTTAPLFVSTWRPIGPICRSIRFRFVLNEKTRHGAVNGNASQFLFLPYIVYTHYWVLLQLHARYGYYDEEQCSKGKQRVGKHC